MPTPSRNGQSSDPESRRYDSAAAGVYLTNRALGAGRDVSHSFGVSSGMRALMASVVAVPGALCALTLGLVGSMVSRFAQHYSYFRELEAAAPLDPLHDIQARLSFTECDILTLMARGYADARIEEILGVRRPAFDSYLRHIYLALGVTNRGQLRVWLAEHGDVFRR